ncbi:MAG: hypothetical protein DCC75_04265 [Proteobacteria bacterium]|nr:MAG: hypothetical protein DCC75_04265 [Pseudomonadota bacterium]
MLPYRPYRPVIIEFGGDLYFFSLFGIFVNLAVLFGILTTLVRARQAKLPLLDVFNLGVCISVVGLFCSRVFEVVFYSPEQLLSSAGWWSLIDWYQSKSSFGGFLGGYIAFIVYSRVFKPGIPANLLSDIVMQGLLVAMIFGRIGCTLTHDHPGTESTFFLAFNYPEGPRHNLGFYEFLYLVLILQPAILYFRSRTPPAGAIAALILTLYAPARFLLDALRIGDSRYLGLTPAQYGCVLLLICGLVWVRRTYRAAST